MNVALAYFFWKKVESFAMPDIFAFFSLSTPCDPFDFALRFLPPSSIASAARDFVPGAPASAIALSSSFNALTYASRGMKLRPHVRW